MMEEVSFYGGINKERAGGINKEKACCRLLVCRRYFKQSCEYLFVSGRKRMTRDGIFHIRQEETISSNSSVFNIVTTVLSEII